MQTFEKIDFMGEKSFFSKILACYTVGGLDLTTSSSLLLHTSFSTLALLLQDIGKLSKKSIFYVENIDFFKIL